MFCAEKQILDELPDEHRCILLETLPTDLPLDLTVPLLADGIYWKRSSQDRWDSVCNIRIVQKCEILMRGKIRNPSFFYILQMNYVCDYGNSWKRLYLERHLQEYIESLVVEEYNQKNVENLVNLCSPYVKRLNIKQLQAAKVIETVEWQSEECLAGKEPGLDHINLEPFIKGLTHLEVIFNEWKSIHM